MKNILIIFICLIPNLLYGQSKLSLNPEPEFLAKYSYICIVNNNANGTCYFYQNGNKTFVITNYHVATGFDPMKGRYGIKVNKLSVVCMDNKQNRIDLNIPLPINFDYSMFYDRPDLYVEELPIPPNIKINYINKLIDSSFFDRKPIAVYSYGYPISAGQDLKTQHKTLVKGLFNRDFLFRSLTINKIKSKQDEIILSNVHKTTFTIYNMEDIGEGRSGSPVFGKFKIRDIYVYRFIGMVFCGKPPYLGAIRAEYINWCFKNLK